MAIPRLVQHWLQLRKQYEDHPDATPRVLPIVKIGPKWYFVDERLHERRNVLDPNDRLPL
jgi:hypothetical protein